MVIASAQIAQEMLDDIRTQLEAISERQGIYQPAWVEVPLNDKLGVKEVVSIIFTIRDQLREKETIFDFDCDLVVTSGPTFKIAVLRMYSRDEQS